VVVLLNRRATQIDCHGAPLRGSLAIDWRQRHHCRVAPSLPDSGVDLYCGIGGSPEGILTAAALKALGGGMLLQAWPRDAEERQRLLKEMTAAELERVFTVDDLVKGDSAVFSATGISDSSLLPGVKLVGNKAITHSILMRARSQTVRYIRAVHDLGTKTIHLRSDQQDHKIDVLA
jgi:fructose-1,6-bisphosphatase II